MAIAKRHIRPLVLVGVLATIAIFSWQYVARAAIGTVGPIDDVSGLDAGGKQLRYVVEETTIVPGAGKAAIPVYRTSPGPIQVTISNIATVDNSPYTYNRRGVITAYTHDRASFGYEGQTAWACTGRSSGSCGPYSVPTTYDMATGLYKAVVRVDDEKNGDNNDKRFVAFSVSIDSGYIGNGANNLYATQMMPYSTSTSGTYKIYMATPCSITSNQSASLIFQDLDSGRSDNGSNFITVSIYDVTSGSRLILKQKLTGGKDRSGNDLPEGNGAIDTLGITFEPLHKYQVDLSTIASQNTMIYKLPYDNVNYAADCKDYDLTPSTTATPSIVVPGDTVEYRNLVKNDGTTGAGNVTYHAWSFVVPRAQRAGFSTSSKGNVDDSDCAALYGGDKQCARTDNGGDPSTNITVANGSVQNFVHPNGTTSFNVATQSLSLHAGDLLCSYVSIKRPYVTVGHNGGKDPGTMPAWRVGAPSCVAVGKRPSVQIWGSDLRVGSPFINGSALNSKVAGSIRTGSDASGVQTYGSWSEYAVIAPGVVSSFSSASGFNRSGTSAADAQSWSRLTFANTPTFGSFGSLSSLGQIPDVETYITRYGTKIGLTVDERTVPSLDLDHYEANKAYVVHGTVHIRENITNPGLTVPGESQLTQMIIIADAIDIDQKVTQIDGWLIARNGTINTCADGAVQLTINDCASPLTINGPVMAEDVTLRRTAGDNKSAAETVNLRADTYLWARNVSLRNGSFHTVYTRELPPRY